MVETLLGTAITLMVCTVVVSALSQLNASARSLRNLTNQYESVRVPANLLMADGRLSLEIICTSNGERATLTMDSSSTWTVQYAIEKRAATPEIADLTRKEVKNSVELSNETVGFDLVSPIYTPVGRRLVLTDGTRFECKNDTGLGASQVTLHLVKPLLPGQTKRIELEATASPR